jgi:hypothetical protein
VSINVMMTLVDIGDDCDDDRYAVAVDANAAIQAGAIVESVLSGVVNESFNVVSGRAATSFAELLDAVRSCGCELEPLSYDAWRFRLQEAASAATAQWRSFPGAVGDGIERRRNRAWPALIERAIRIRESLTSRLCHQR